MSKRPLTLALLIGAAVAAFVSHPLAQLAAPGPSGVVLGHLHLGTKDIEASRRFWAAVGGVAVQNGTLQLIQLPGTFVMLRQSAQIAGGSEGSTVEQIGLGVRPADVSGLLKQIEQAGGTKSAAGVMSPEGISLDLHAVGGIPVPLMVDRIVFRSVAPVEMRDWYVKTFGAQPSESRADATGRPPIPVAQLPGLQMQFKKADTAPAGTRGRGLDHIGFEVKNLEAFCKNLEAAGLKLDRAYTRLPNSAVAIAFLTDPWGTYIELTENLAPQGK
jgi:catechol 2,3-dioxygenase-like lactoylglutathione lyase family enzyme